jgi:hypothetical protein
MTDPLDELLEKLRRLRDMAQAIAESAAPSPPPAEDKPQAPQLRVKQVTIADFHRTPRRFQ